MLGSFFFFCKTGLPDWCCGAVGMGGPFEASVIECVCIIKPNTIDVNTGAYVYILEMFICSNYVLSLCCNDF